MKLLVRMPTRSRPVQALHVLSLYRKLAHYPISIEVVMDEDDQTMQTPNVLQKLHDLGCVLTYGKHKSKIEAVNNGRVSDWDILLLASDDMLPVCKGWDQKVMEAMEKHWPCLDGAIFFDDGFQGNHICTLPIIGRRFYDHFC